MTAQMRKHLGHRQTGLAARGDDGRRCLRMTRQQTQQLGPGIARAADDSDSDHAQWTPASIRSNRRPRTSRNCRSRRPSGAGC